MDIHEKPSNQNLGTVYSSAFRYLKVYYGIMLQFSRLILLISCMSVIGSGIRAQNCTALGQNPGTAFPVCGTNTFTQTTVPICGDRNIPVPCNTAGVPYQDKNPYWYKFTCFTAGTIGFLITPKNLNDDYDWQIFDITGKNPDDVFLDKNLLVSCNWSGEPGVTGSSDKGTSLTECGGLGINRFSKMANLIQGHNYLLLVSHFSGSDQSGYTLEFKGGTASITDPIPPALASATPECDGSQIYVKLKTRVNCNSLSLDGSEFILPNGVANVTGVEGQGCNTGFDMDLVLVKLDKPLPPGSYQISIQNGTDGNTLLNTCGTPIPAGQQLDFAIEPHLPAKLDSLSGSICAPQTLNLYFSHPINCNSVSNDASEFLLTGPQTVNILSATTPCGTGNQGVITLTLSEPIVKGGSYTIQLQKGTDGNVILDQCGMETNAGNTASIQLYDTVSAKFSYQVLPGCKLDTLLLNHSGNNANYSLQWYLNGVPGSSSPQASWIVPGNGDYTLRLTAANQGCSDSSYVSFSLSDGIKANFETDINACPKDGAIVRDLSEGPIEQWLWTWGNGNTNSNPDPGPLVFPQTGVAADYPIALVVSRNNGTCADTLVKIVHVLATCNIDVPTAFTPNGDGLNDYLYPLNAVKAEQLVFRVFDRWGKLVWETKDWTRKWDGTFNGTPQPAGVYAWKLDYIFIDTQKKFNRKGTTMLIR